MFKYSCIYVTLDHIFSFIIFNKLLGNLSSKYDVGCSGINNNKFPAGKVNNCDKYSKTVGNITV